MFNFLRKPKTTKVTIVVEYVCDYDGHIDKDNVDYSDVLTTDNIKAIAKMTLKHKGSK